MIKKLSKSIREYKKPSILTAVFVLIEVILEVLIPYIMSDLIDQGIYGNSMPIILKYGLLLVLLAFTSLFFGYLSGSFCAKASSGFAKNLRSDMFKKIQTFSFSNIDKFSKAGLVTRLTIDVGFIQNTYQMIIRTAIRAPLMLILSFVLTLTLNPIMALILLALSPILVIGLFFILKNVNPIYKRAIVKYDNLNNVVQENIKASRVVKAYVREDYETQKFNKISDEICTDYIKGRKILSLSSPLMMFVVYACMLLISYVGAQIIVRSGGTEFTTGQLTIMFSYTMQILVSLMMLSFILVNVSISRPSAERIVEILEEEQTISNPQNALRKIKNGDVDFENVCFSYAGDISKLCLKNINLHISSGQMIGILGDTGSSKSTLVSLIPRLYDVTSGEVKVGGKNVKDYDLETLRDGVAMVLQKNTLFSGTIKQNLMWGNEYATQKEIEHACDVACASEFINNFVDKYDTYVEQGGTNLSGGQKQRLCIARALLKKPRILILDDSTSAVDTKTDNQIKQAFKNELPKTTKIIISQRVSSIKEADMILVLESGNLVAKGTHSELLKSSTLYKEIYESQTRKKGGDRSNEK